MVVAAGGAVLDTFTLPDTAVGTQQAHFLACAARCMVYTAADVTCTGVVLDTATASCALLGSLTSLYGADGVWGVGRSEGNMSASDGVGAGLYVRQGMHPDGVVYDRDGAMLTSQAAHTTLDLLVQARDSTATATAADGLVFDGTRGVSVPFTTMVAPDEPITFDFLMSINTSTSGYYTRTTVVSVVPLLCLWFMRHGICEVRFIFGYVSSVPFLVRYNGL